MKEKVTKDKDVDFVDDKDNIEVYELGYHIVPLVSEEDLPKEVAQIHSLMVESGGGLLSEAFPTIRQLPYEITKKIETKNVKFSKAFFGWVKFEISSSQISNFESKIKKLSNILRFIIIKTVKENTIYTPKIPLFKKEVNKEDASLGVIEKSPVSEEEIDKSIDELLVNENSKL